MIALKMRLSILTGILGLAAAFPLFLNASSANAASDVYFYPAQGWSVASAMNAGQNTCSARAVFNNGFVMSFAGSDKWVESLNIDIKQSALTAGKSYPITLSVPGLSSKKLIAQALSTKDLTLKMTGNKDLYKMIHDSSVFDFTLEGNEFRFYMVGFADKAKQFEQCMAGRTQENSALQVITNESLKMETLETNALSAPQNNARNNAALNKTAALNSAAPKRTPVSTITAAATTAAPRTPSTDMLPLPTAAQSNATPIKPATATRTPVREKMKPATPVIDVTAAAARPVPPSATMETTRQNYKTDLKIQKTSRSVEADLTDIPPAKASRIKRSSAAHEKIAMNTTDTREITKLKRMVADLQAENKALNNEVRKISSQSREEGDTIETRNWNLERATMRFHEAERQLKRLGQQVQQERSKCMLETQELEAMLFDPQVTEAQQSAHLADLKRQLEDAHRQLDAQRR